MKYHGNNPLGMALATDLGGTVRDAVLRRLQDYQSANEQHMRLSTTPATYQRQLAAVDCAMACAEVVKEFHAVCVSYAAEQEG